MSMTVTSPGWVTAVLPVLCRRAISNRHLARMLIDI
jgi:hypothetical protein